jgi:hypothetical protein
MTIEVIDDVILDAALTAGSKGEPCPGCHRLLPVCDPAGSGMTAEWDCGACHATVRGVLMQDLATTFGERVRLANPYFDSTRAEPIPQTLRHLVSQCLVRRRVKQETHERRRNPRVPCDLDAVVVALDDRWVPCGEAVNAVVIDLAAHGLGMMTATRVSAAQLAIQIQYPAGLVQLIGRNAWSNYVGGGFQNTGVEFLARLGRREETTNSGVVLLSNPIDVGLFAMGASG